MSFIISFYGKSGTGKSTAQTLMASMFTHPKDMKLYIPFFGTLNAIVKNLTRKFGVPQIFDEATVSAGLNMESLILAGKVLLELGVNIDIDSITAIIAENCNSIREATDIAEKYYQHLLTYIALHPYMEGLKRMEDTNTAAMIDDTFLDILEGYGASNPNLVIKALDAAGYLFKRKPNSIKNRLRFNGVLKPCYEIVLPEDDAGSDDGCMTLEYILTHFEGIDEEVHARIISNCS